MTAASTPISETAMGEPVNSAMARKRRREILSSQRATCVPPDGDIGGVAAATTIEKLAGAHDQDPLRADSVSVSDDDEPAKMKQQATFTAKEKRSGSVTESSGESDEDRVEGKKTKRSKTGGRVSSCESEKKPQMRYDPDVPMSKDEAAAWRREQRRKRNRESAAASRQKQRDRIAELEVEVDEWKKKFADAMDRLRKLEEQVQGSRASVGEQDASDVSPSATGQDSVECQLPSPPLETVESGGEEKHHLFEKISRQA